MPDLSNKVAIVTGGNSGLGFCTAKALASKGAHVVLAVRSRDKGQVAADKILSEFPDAQVLVMKLDLANIESVKHFAESFKEEFDRLDLLINNAGVMAIPLSRTKDGFEMQFGTNHLGHFVLTSQLIDLVRKTSDSRIINVSSLMHKRGKMHFEDLNWEKSYNKWAAYGMSKLSNLLFTLELDKRLTKSGSKVITAAAHPGWASTNLQTRGAEMEGSRFMIAANNLGNKLIAQSASMGALPTLYAATASDIEPGSLYGPQGLFGLRGYPGKDKLDRKLVNPVDAAKLWEASEKLTGVKFDVA